MYGELTKDAEVASEAVPNKDAVTPLDTCMLPVTVCLSEAKLPIVSPVFDTENSVPLPVNTLNAPDTITGWFSVFTKEEVRALIADTTVVDAGWTTTHLAPSH